MRDPLELRPARPQDADFLAWGLEEAVGGLFSTMFGGSSTAILASVVAQPGHQLSYEHAVLATVDGQVKGFYQGWPYGTPSANERLMRAAGLIAVRAAAVGLLGHPVFSALDRHSPGEWYLQAIAVLPQARGGGIGHALLMDAIAKAAFEGCDSVALDIDAANVRAQSLYERLGLRVASTSLPAVLLGNLRVHRMLVHLDIGRVHAVEQVHQADATEVIRSTSLVLRTAIGLAMGLLVGGFITPLFEVSSSWARLAISIAIVVASLAVIESATKRIRRWSRTLRLKRERHDGTD